MTRFVLPFLLAAPLALAACGDAEDAATDPVATSSQMPPGASDPAGAHEHMAPTDRDAVTAEMADGTQTVEIEAGRMGYEPRRIHLEADVPARLVFTRTVENECSERITIPAYDVERDLPLGEPVAVEFTPTETGEIEFVCGMDMQRGTIAIAS